jgi:hypothetical protein
MLSCLGLSAGPRLRSLKWAVVSIASVFQCGGRQLRHDDLADADFVQAWLIGSGRQLKWTVWHRSGRER